MMDKEGISWEFLVNSQRGIANLKQIDNEFDKLKNSAKQVEGQVGDSFTKMDGKVSKFKSGLSSLAGEFPLLGNAIRLATSPMGLFAISLIGITAAFSKGTAEAKKFDNTFLEVKNLNLEKTSSQLDNLRDSILDTSFEKGLDPTKFARGMFDVQSATGKYGDEVIDIVQKIGVFSRTMKSDFNVTIEGASKAMGIFKFGADGLDEYLASSAKVVQLGITTFDQLAKVQTEFSGAAAASGQGFNEANKIFSVFTKTQKNVDIAATMTKGFFDDLKKLEKIKINVFENGSFRKTDDILKDVNDKFKKLDKQSVSNLIEQIGGNEGLEGLLKQVSENGDDVLKLFKDFDNQEFDFDKALANANGDLEVMNEIVENKLTAAWIRLGDTIAPILVDIKSWLADAMDWAGEFFTTLHRGWLVVSGDFAKINKMDREQNARDFKDHWMEDIQGQLDKIQDPEEKKKKLDYFIQSRQEMNQYSAESVEGAFQDPLAFYKKRNEKAILKSDQLTGNPAIDGQVLGKELRDKKIDYLATNMLVDDLKEMRANMNSDNSILDPNKTHLPGGGADDSIKGISVAGAAVRHVTVNIENLIRENIINASSAQNGVMMTADEITQIIVRAVRDAELTLSSNG